ncbi:hypothetical protein PPM_p0088 (plasmid) [Paenibacillus polymyxa M1]|uniref:hypothetical protein n=2 Tax=Paenibacillus polymyxa TaxID=1406 RepID=UPI00021BBB44|nr:hypothetical protein [Paenibacillus polymyxa]CCC86238.1 hypothetical protein PPM_p0088 [Paenibacillus polymyxa M1]
MKLRTCHGKIMELEVIKDEYDPEDMIFSFNCSVCEDGYSVGWLELCGDVIYLEKDALQRLKNNNND